MLCGHVSIIPLSISDCCLLAVAGESALTLAAGSGEQQTVQLLLDHGADISRCRTAGAQAIHTAAASGAAIQQCMHCIHCSLSHNCHCYRAEVHYDWECMGIARIAVFCIIAHWNKQHAVSMLMSHAKVCNTKSV